MEKKILIRYGELTLKKNNRNFFIKTLKNNICKYIKSEDIKMEYDRAFINYSLNNFECLKYIFGINSYSIVYEVNNDLKEIENIIYGFLENIGNAKTFAINSRRHIKTFPFKSNELNIYFGNYVSKILPNLKVKLKNPDLLINIEIRDKHTYVFLDNNTGLGGLPTSCSGKTLHLMSGGIDSPVAANLLQKRGLQVYFLNFITPPHTDLKTEEKVKNLVEILSKYQKNTTLFQINFTKIMNYLNLIENQKYKITLMRRSFYRIATLIANQNKIMVLSNGDNLGQVASQTLESMANISSCTNLEIFRPLLTYDKNDIINQAKQIGTYDISIQKACETCELFAPKCPITKPKIKEINKLEKELENLEILEKESVDNLKIFYF